MMSSMMSEEEMAQMEQGGDLTKSEDPDMTSSDLI